jgi:endonuclease YncB( thermonuclease family)
LGSKGKVWIKVCNSHSKRVYGKVVEVEPLDVCRYGRNVALIRVEGGILNEELIKEGFAWV